MQFEQYDFMIGSHYLPALINGDDSGLTTKEENKLEYFIDAWMKPGAHWAIVEDVGLDLCEVSGLYNDCIKVALMVPIEV